MLTDLKFLFQKDDDNEFSDEEFSDEEDEDEEAEAEAELEIPEQKSEN